jgi:hypothetical protein
MDPFRVDRQHVDYQISRALWQGQSDLRMPSEPSEFTGTVYRPCMPSGR